MSGKIIKKKEVYKQTYRKGSYIVNDQKDRMLKLLSSEDCFWELVNAGINDDDTEFFTIKFNNIKP